MVSYCLVSRPHEITIYPRYGKTNHCFFASSSCFPDGSPGTALPQTGREGQCRTKGGSGRITLSYHREVCGADRGWKDYRISLADRDKGFGLRRRFLDADGGLYGAYGHKNWHRDNFYSHRPRNFFSLARWRGHCFRSFYIRFRQLFRYKCTPSHKPFLLTSPLQGVERKGLWLGKYSRWVERP